MDDILNRSVSHWLLVIKYIIPLCTLGSIYSTNAGGAGEMTETNNSNQTAGYLQSWSRIWTRDYHEQIQLAVRAGLELGAFELQVHCWLFLMILQQEIWFWFGGTFDFVHCRQEKKPGGTPLYKRHRYVPPQRVWFLGLFGLKTGTHFAHFGLEWGMVLRELRECMNLFIVSFPNE